MHDQWRYRASKIMAATSFGAFYRTPSSLRLASIVARSASRWVSMTPSSIETAFPTKVATYRQAWDWVDYLQPLVTHS